MEAFICLLTVGLVIFVLRISRSHQDFQDFVSEQLKIHYSWLGRTHTLLLYQRELASVWIVDLSKVVAILGDRYSSNRGAPARDPVDLFRSLLLMELDHESSIDALPVYHGALISGKPAINGVLLRSVLINVLRKIIS